MNIPSNLKYSKSDEWVLVEKQLATIGVTDFAQDQLSDIVFWEANVEENEQVKKGAVIATLESVKAAGEVLAPVTGKVIKINSDLANTPEVVNSDPYGKAWMIKIEMEKPDELNTLMDAVAYKKDTESREH